MSRQGQVIPSSDVRDFHNVLPGGIYTEEPPVAEDGQYVPNRSNPRGAIHIVEQEYDRFVDSSNGVAAFAVKPLAVATYSWTVFSNWGANTTLNIKATTGNIYAAYFYQTNAANRFEQLHNTATTPSASAVPVYSFLVEPSKDKVIGGDFFGANGANGSNGWAFAHSTAFGIYTAGTAADGNRTIHYK